MNASDVLVERLLAWGVDTIFGLPGDGINGVMEALRKAQDKIRFIHVRHEESAAFRPARMPNSPVVLEFASPPPGQAESIF
jgi:thiamine pyrophosphate-dependent acetolactate synthase large subunit-like protein